MAQPSESSLGGGGIPPPVVGFPASTAGPASTGLPPVDTSAPASSHVAPTAGAINSHSSEHRAVVLPPQAARPHKWS